jgi:uncharacterized protein YndB with AHSA1/START domain
VAVVDEGFVRAVPDEVFELLLEPGRYPEWWPGVRSRRAKLVVRVLGPIEAGVERVRPGKGLFVRVAGRRVEGHLEWFLEPVKEGTMVHCITNLTTRRRWGARRTLAHRAGVRRALVALKGELE